MLMVLLVPSGMTTRTVVNILANAFLAVFGNGGSLWVGVAVITGVDRVLLRSRVACGARNLSLAAMGEREGMGKNCPFPPAR